MNADEHDSGRQATELEIKRGLNFIKSVANEESDTKRVLILNGDFCDKGRVRDYGKLFKDLILDPLLNLIPWDLVIAVPGNHDIKLGTNIEDKLLPFHRLFNDTSKKVKNFITPFTNEKKPFIQTLDGDLMIWPIDSTVACGSPEVLLTILNNQIIGIVDKFRQKHIGDTSRTLIIKDYLDFLKKDNLDNFLQYELINNRNSSKTKKPSTPFQKKVVEEIKEHIVQNFYQTPGKVNDSLILNAERYLNSVKAPLRIAISHHNSLLSIVNENEQKFHSNPATLNNFLIKNCFHFIFHGHIHRPHFCKLNIPSISCKSQIDIRNKLDCGLWNVGVSQFKFGHPNQYRGFNTLTVSQQKGSWLGNAVFKEFHWGVKEDNFNLDENTQFNIYLARKKLSNRKEQLSEEIKNAIYSGKNDKQLKDTLQKIINSI